MALGTEGYSAALVAKIEYAGANEGSFGQASEALKRLAELPISAKHVQRITERLGRERAARRDRDVELMKAGKFAPAHAQPPRVAAIHLDAGKVQMRAEDGKPGVRDPHWSDTKVGCLLTYAAPSGHADPQPKPPKAFLDPPRVMRLCQEIRQVRSDPSTRPTAARTRAKPAVEAVIEKPQRLVRTAVATMQRTESFGWMVATEAMARGFYEAESRAIIGDGGNWIEPLGQMHFPGWVQILDFLHLLVHLYAAATAAYRGQGKLAWRLYERMLRSAWAGKVALVLGDLKEQAQRLGQPAPQARDDDPRKIVAKTLAYVQKNADRMDYPKYRREGLPVTSAAVESLIKQFNQRVKGTEKFWLTGGAEAVLQVRAAYLSDDGRGEEFHQYRPRGHAVGRNRLQPAA
ncbi:MAG: hypothetical protein KKI02_03200 [Planctomycetes bacterium]|nr:hypothetical protein [Planctomycetota bacterium]